MSFASVAFPFNATRTVQANAQLGIFPASNYSSTYGTGGDDTAAVQAALNAAIAVGGIALLTPPSAGTVNISAPLNLGNSGVSLVGASPSVTIRVIPGSNLDFVVSTGLPAAVDYRKVFSINYRAITVAGNSYTSYDPNNPAKLANGGAIQNIRFVADTSPVSALGHCILLNGAYGFSITNTTFSGFTGEDVSLWDCYGTKITNCDGSPGYHIGVHRACYDTQIFGANVSAATASSFRVYTEQFQVPSGPLLTLSPFFTKFVDCHGVSTAILPYAFDLSGAVYVNLSGCTADNAVSVVGTTTRFGAPTVNVLSDVGAVSGIAAVGVTAPITSTGGSSPNIGLGGLTGYGSPGQVPTVAAGGTSLVWVTPQGGTTTVTAPITNTGTAQNPIIGITSPLPVANGGSGTASPSIVAGSGISVSGSWPNQTVSTVGGVAPTFSKVTIANYTDTGATTPTQLGGLTLSLGPSLSATTAYVSFNSSATSSHASRYMIYLDGVNAVAGALPNASITGSYATADGPYVAMVANVPVAIPGDGASHTLAIYYAVENSTAASTYVYASLVVMRV